MAADELRAALAVAELEDELIAAKGAGASDTPEFRDLKVRLREARRAYRAEYRTADPDQGGAVAQPETFAGSAEVHE